MTEPPAALRQALLAGEEVLWHGRPHPIAGIGWTVFVSLFGLLLLLLIARSGGTAAMTMNDVPVHDPATRWTMRLLFMAVATATTLFFPYRVLRRLSTIYAVTDRRVLVLAGIGLPPSVQSFPPRSIWGTERPDKPSADAIGRLLILRAKPRQKRDRAVEWLVEFSEIRDDIGAQAAINGLVAAPRALIGHRPAAIVRPEGLAASLHWSLRPGERLVWAAEPDRARYALGALVPALVMALFLAPFVVAFLTGSVFDPFMLILAAVVAAGPVLAWRDAARLVFAITTERVIIQQRRKRRTGEVAWPLAAIESIHRSPPKGRSGSLALRDGRRPDHDGHPARLVLRALPDAAAAEAALFVALDGPRRDEAARSRQDALA
ncbi:hypothetical protein G3576_13335 [Roseomonas stagni]|uniref:PH domain-containing protein n=1 Tax=Falsiroseomonas algicola TaxID=2716930 RepID=A0A6M1LL09_9PROT|nr:hypothetical protein [Falsiroseomonas algicola]NGM21001.1 hypothetical protein [Falsiroseomonas algicola]